MALSDMLVYIATYPEPTSPETIDQAVQFAAKAGGRLSALAVEVEFRRSSSWLADRAVGISSLAAEAEQESGKASRNSLAIFATQAKAAGVLGQTLRSRVDLHAVPQQVVRFARTRDLCLLPFNPRESGCRLVAEATVFDSGRPVLVFQPGDAIGERIGTVAVAWDGSRSAARAMADALPLLARAARVQVVTVLNEKPEAVTGIGDEAVRHLKYHGVNATSVEVDANGQRVGSVLESFVLAQQPNLLVLGAYGRSRIREFVLGGATEHLLRDPKLPLLLSY